jgi:hypothetical protein
VVVTGYVRQDRLLVRPREHEGLLRTRPGAFTIKLFTP